MAVGISNILALLGGVALFLFGMGLMGDSLKLVAGQRLELILYRLSNTPLKGVLLGTAVTAEQLRTGVKLRKGKKVFHKAVLA